MSVYLSMAAFALVASITPGPVNLVALGSAAQYGLMPALRHVLGATLGFVLLLVLSGFGLHQLLDAAGVGTRYPVGGRGVLVVDGVATGAGRWPAQCPFAAAAAVLVVWRLDAMAEPQSVGGCAGGHERICADGDRALIWQFAGLYLVICYVSVGSWPMPVAIYGAICSNRPACGNSTG